MIYIQNPIIVPKLDSVKIGEPLPIFGRTLGMNFKDLIYCNIAKQLIDKNNIVYPQWTNMVHYNDTKDLDIAKEIFDIPNYDINSPVISNTCWPSEGICELETNILFKDWCKKNICDADISKICKNIIGYSHIIEDKKYLRNVFKNAISFINIKQKIKDKANEYISNEIGTNYISIGIRTTSYMKILSSASNTNEQEYYEKMLQNYSQILKEKTKEYSINSIFVTSESSDTIQDFIDVYNDNNINFYYNKNEYKRKKDYKYKKYTQDETIDYYYDLVKEALILGNAKCHMSTISHFQFFSSVITDSNWYILNNNTFIGNEWQNLIKTNKLIDKQVF